MQVLHTFHNACKARQIGLLLEGTTTAVRQNQIQGLAIKEDLLDRNNIRMSMDELEGRHFHQGILRMARLIHFGTVVDLDGDVPTGMSVFLAAARLEHVTDIQMSHVRSLTLAGYGNVSEVVVATLEGVAKLGRHGALLVTPVDVATASSQKDGLGEFVAVFVMVVHGDC